MFRDFSPHRFRAASTAAAMATAVLLAQWATAAPNIDQVGSLKLVPQDAAFYAVSLKNRQRVEAVLNSRAFAKLREMPAVQEGLEELREQLDGPKMAVPRALLSLPENVQLVETLLDMVSDEVFIYGSADYAGLIESMNEVNLAVRHAQIEGVLEGQPDERAIVEAMAKAVSQLEDVAIPDTVIGFALDDVDRAKTQLKRLEVLLTLVLSGQEEWKGRFKRVTIGQGDFLTFEFDGSLLPWDEMLDELEGSDLEAAEKIVDVLEEKTLTVSLGIVDHYLLLSFGDNNEHLAALGKGKTLASHPKLEPVRKHAGRPLISICYASEPFAKKANSAGSQIDDLIELLEQAMPLAEKIPENHKASIISDVKALGEEIKAVIPEAGAEVSFAFLTHRGVEGFSYNWSECPVMDASKPLTILNHVGKNPLMFCAGRTKRSVACYRRSVYWLEKAFKHAEAICVPQMDPEKRGVYKAVRKQMLPLLAQLDEATAEKMIPALADGQGALVIDAMARDVQWCDQMEPADKPLPLPVPSLVLGVSDAELLKQGYEQYVDVINKVALKLHALNPDEVPECKFPQPATRMVPEGALYVFAVPKKCGVSPKLTPSIGLSDDTVVVTFSRRHARSLLKSQPLNVGGPLSDLEKPMAAAAYCNWAGIVEALRPWIHYGAKQDAKAKAVSVIDDDHGDNDDGDEDEADDDDEDDDEPDLEAILAQVDTVLDVLKCFRGCSAATYIEGGATVTHFEWRVRDLKP